MSSWPCASTESVYVFDDRCSHEEFSLSEGEVDVETGEIECARHGAMFRLQRRRGRDAAGDASGRALRRSSPERGRLEVEVP